MKTTVDAPRRAARPGPRLAGAFAACFLLVGVPYWSLRYEEVNLPQALFGPGLFAVAIAALLLCLFRVAPCRLAAGIMAAAAPAAVLARVVVECAKDPTDHNLWPLELMLASAVGLAWAGGGAVAGALLARAGANRNRGGSR